jgi:hypothetical protein
MKGRIAMATVPAPRSDVYLSLLAAKALTALANLANNPAAWNDRIKIGLESGMEYCEAYRCKLSSHSKRSNDSRGFKRRAIDSGDGSIEVSPRAGCEAMKELLSGILLRNRQPATAELDAAIDFFSAGAY